MCNHLSYVEYYEPDYFQLENVSGIFSYRLGGDLEGRRIVRGVVSGVVKLIYRILMDLGQVVFLLHYVFKG